MLDRKCLDGRRYDNIFLRETLVTLVLFSFFHLKFFVTLYLVFIYVDLPTSHFSVLKQFNSKRESSTFPIQRLSQPNI